MLYLWDIPVGIAGVANFVCIRPSAALFNFLFLVRPAGLYFFLT
jgi:hypothetical protein